MSARPKSKVIAARERAAAIRAAQAKAERRRRILIAGSAIGVVVVIIAALVIAKIAGVGSGGSKSPAAASGEAPPAVVNAVTHVPAATLDRIGAGTAAAAPRHIKAPALTQGGKPRMLYIGADYCPYCAAERWPMAVALSRFGTWSHLGTTTSASKDVYPSTQTLSFHGASYVSDYLIFTGVETSGNQLVNGKYASLDQPSSADQKLFSTYNQPPYVSGQAGGIPFLDIGGAYVTSGASYSPDILKGKSRQQIAEALADPGSAIAKAVDGSANLITAALCAVIGSPPAAVCDSAGVKTAAAALAKG